MKRSLEAGIIALVAGALLAIGFSLLDYPSEGFWSPYVVGLRGTGYFLLIFGFLWACLGALERFTHFFDLKQRMSSEGFLLWCGGVIGACILLSLLVLPYVPKTPVDQMPLEPKSRERALIADANFRKLCVVSIALTGLVILSVPTRRFMRS